jgi:acyl dehydratase
MSQDLIYYEDLAIGRRFQTAAVEVTAADIAEFASRFDPQPFHLDEAAGRGSVFGGMVASGWLTGALTMRLMVQGEMKLAGGLIGLGIDSLQWPRAVRPGDRLTAATEVMEMRLSASKPDYGVVKLRTVTTNQAGETVQVLVANQLVLRRQGGAGCPQHARLTPKNP